MAKATTITQPLGQCDGPVSAISPLQTEGPSLMDSGTGHTAQPVDSRLSAQVTWNLLLKPLLTSHLAAVLWGLLAGVKE
jgi:hypothetical protein